MIKMPEPVAWRSRYCSPQGMIGHYPWSYVEHSLRQPALNNYDIESLITTTQAEAYADAVRREALEEAASVAKQASDKYAYGYYGNEVDTADEIEVAIRALIK